MPTSWDGGAYFDQIVALLGPLAAGGESAFVQAISQWQATKGLPANGVLDAMNWAQMQGDLAAGPAAPPLAPAALPLAPPLAAPPDAAPPLRGRRPPPPGRRRSTRRRDGVGVRIGLHTRSSGLAALGPLPSYDGNASNRAHRAGSDELTPDG